MYILCTLLAVNEIKKDANWKIVKTSTPLVNVKYLSLSSMENDLVLKWRVFWMVEFQYVKSISGQILSSFSKSIIWKHPSGEMFLRDVTPIPCNYPIRITFCWCSCTHGQTRRIFIRRPTTRLLIDLLGYIVSKFEQIHGKGPVVGRSRRPRLGDSHMGSSVWAWGSKVNKFEQVWGGHPCDLWLNNYTVDSSHMDTTREETGGQADNKGVFLKWLL